MGELNIPLEPLKKQRTRAWHPLQADAEGKHKSSNVCGEVELVLYWTYNDALDFDPFLEEDAFPEKPSNELRIGLAQGRNLAIKDKDLFGSGGSSDPRVIFTVDGTELKATSTCKKKTLNPRWKEIFVLPYTRGPEDSQPPFLTVTCEDVDELTSADFMGRVQIELDPLLDHKRSRAWHALQAKSDAKTSSNIAGDLDIVLQWHYNPAHDFDPFPDDELGADKDALYADKAPNELRLALVQGRGLAIKDKNLLSKGGSSDPFVKFEVPLKQDAEQDNPVVDVTVYDHDEVSSPDFMGREHENPPFLDVILEDVDAMSAADFMGRVKVELTPLKDHKRLRKWFPLQADAEDTKSKASSNVTGELELIVQWRFNKELQFSPFDDVPDELIPAGKTPNELRCCLAQARRLAIRIRPCSGRAARLRQAAGRARRGEAPSLTVVMEDWDEVTSRDFMGQCAVDLGPWLADPFKDSDGTPGKAPNALRIGLGSGRDLAVKDKALLYGEGSSDPRCVFDIALRWRRRRRPPKSRATQKKTLNPSWREVLELEVDDASASLRCVCEDVDELTSADFMGEFLVPLADLPDQKVTKKWYALGKSDKHKSDNISGDVELVLQWYYDEKLDFDAFPDVDDSGKPPNELRAGVFKARNLAIKDKNLVTKNSSDPSSSYSTTTTLAEHAGKEPNELRIGLFQATGLAIKDKNLLSKGGSSDPRVTFTVPGTHLKAVSACKKKTLDPSGRRFSAENEDYAGKEPNELRIAAVQALGLAIADKNLLSAGGSSDPFLRFTIPEMATLKAFKTHVKKNSLDPSWHEQFAKAVCPPKEGSLTLQVDCEDWDEISAADFMGRATIDLAPFKDQKISRKWYELKPAEGKKGDVSGHVELIVQWRHDPALAFEPFSEDKQKDKEPNELRVRQTVEYPDEEPNELRVAVARGRGLKIMDKNLLSKGGSSDPVTSP
ncbi:hypothetical protein JL721_12360 [Aureococcus anophagefferens]|nr:hypothetical protein JL721_12360 [Aureococcus anophagefferens]